jgi:RNA polymerase sigma-70 factor (ECF subfamily)
VEVPAQRLRAAVVGNHALVWRTLRRFGVSTARVDEAVSHVFDVLTRRLDDVVPGKEAAFLIQTASRVASEFRRSDARRARVEGQADRKSDPPSPEELFERRQARAMLDEVLEGIEPDARAVFVLHELEQLTAARIAELLDIPPGTVASRLRRGREQFEQAAVRLRRRLAGEGEQP